MNRRLFLKKLAVVPPAIVAITALLPITPPLKEIAFKIPLVGIDDLPTVSWRQVNDAWTESTGTFQSDIQTIEGFCTELKARAFDEAFTNA